MIRRELKPGDDSRRNFKPINRHAFKIERIEGSLLDISARSGFPNLLTVGGWRFASPIAYDKTRFYSRGECVVVIPTNTVVVDGHEDPVTEELIHTHAGTWVCLKSPKVPDPENEGEYLIHTPQWPPPTPNDPDAENNYWWIVAGYPICF